jgi:hypothetical protein
MHFGVPVLPEVRAIRTGASGVAGGRAGPRDPAGADKPSIHASVTSCWAASGTARSVSTKSARSSKGAASSAWSPAAKDPDTAPIISQAIIKSQWR